MQKNVGNFDRIVRLVVGVALLAVGGAAFAGMLTLATGTLGTGLAALAVLLGVVMLVTGATRTCAIYSLLGIDTSEGDPTTETVTEETKTGPRPN